MEITVTRDGGAVMLSLRGALDRTADLETEFGKLDGISDLVLDLKEVNFIDTMGLRQLAIAQKLMLGRGTLSLINVPRFVLDALTRTGLWGRFCILS